MKPKLKTKGQDGNIFAVLGNASKVLKHEGLTDKANEMKNRVMSAENYNIALAIISEYVDWE